MAEGSRFVVCSIGMLIVIILVACQPAEVETPQVTLVTDAADDAPLEPTTVEPVEVDDYRDLKTPADSFNALYDALEHIQ